MLTAVDSRAANPDGAGHPALMPLPAHLEFESGSLRVSRDFSVAFPSQVDPRIGRAVDRAVGRLERRTGIQFERPTSTDAAQAALVIRCTLASAPYPALGEDESYSLIVAPGQARLDAPTTLGVLRGLETFLQLVRQGPSGWSAACVRITDRPRFPWRGLMIDVARHWQPIDVIERNLDGMAMVKLNVLHLHLTDDQGFRIQSLTHPELQEKGSDGHYFTQDQIRTIIAYAADRGIRVVPEFDVPGHATSWVVSHPELASAPGPYQIERKWGVFNPVLDPTNPGVYRLLGDFLGEMAALFPDPYMHLGGDENNGVQWNANPHIQAFIREHHLQGNEGLHTYFNQRMIAILDKHGKRLVGWDEILQPGLPTSSVIQSWRGTDALAAAARRGYSGLLSNGYYIDLMQPAGQHYLVDPLPASSTLDATQRARILGGEATMWSEWVSPETIDSRIWPRTAAIAERLWSPANVRDVDDMYRRLAVISSELAELGLEHLSSREKILADLGIKKLDAPEAQALRLFAGIVEPVKGYARGKCQPWMTQLLPLTTMADAAGPDSTPSRGFSRSVGRLLAGPAFDVRRLHSLERALTGWARIGRTMSDEVVKVLPSLADSGAIGRQLEDASEVGLRALRALESGRAPTPDRTLAEFAVLDAAAAHNGAAVEIPALPAIRLLVAAAGEQNRRTSLGQDAWRRLVEERAAPPRPAR